MKLLSLAPLLIAAGCAQPISVQTADGEVTGSTLFGVSRFLGIPFAAPPIGALRFRPPEAPTPWTIALDANRVGPPCPQPNSAQPYSEDCLRLNVWTPSPLPASALPVMVFVHGGSFLGGSGGDPLYDGNNLARDAKLVVVTINYRLGPLGFLAHPALVAEDEHASAGNYGLLDQQRALAWVKANISAFGGDPENVTLFGESAGSISVCAQMASPLAAGLFQRGIGESGSCVFMNTPLSDDASGIKSAVSLGTEVATTLGCDPQGDVAACLRHQSVDGLLAAKTPDQSLKPGTPQYGPNLDGWVLPRDLLGAFRDGKVNRVPYLTGANQDEGTLFGVLTQVPTRAEFEHLVAGIAPHHTQETIALYPEAKYSNPHDAWVALIGDAFVCGQRLQAKLHSTIEPRTYLYLFTHPNLAGTLSGFGVAHGTELPYVFQNFVFPFVEQQADHTLSQRMIGYWSRFAATGDPNGGDALSWPALDNAGHYIDLDTMPTIESQLRAEICDVIEPWIGDL